MSAVRHAYGLAAAVRWVGDTLPMYALTLVLTTATELWALRYRVAEQRSVEEVGEDRAQN